MDTGCNSCNYTGRTLCWWENKIWENKANTLWNRHSRLALLALVAHGGVPRELLICITYLGTQLLDSGLSSVSLLRSVLWLTLTSKHKFGIESGYEVENGKGRSAKEWIRRSCENAISNVSLTSHLCSLCSVLSLHLEKGNLGPGLENFCQSLDLYGHYAENLEQANKTLKVNIYFSLHMVYLFPFCETATSFHLSCVFGDISALTFSGLTKFRLSSTIKWWKLLYLFRASNFWCFFQVFVYVWMCIWWALLSVFVFLYTSKTESCIYSHSFWTGKPREFPGFHYDTVISF